VFLVERKEHLYRGLYLCIGASASVEEAVGAVEGEGWPGGDDRTGSCSLVGVLGEDIGGDADGGGEGEPAAACGAATEGGEDEAVRR
jgi:hypothetical protein